MMKLTKWSYEDAKIHVGGGVEIPLEVVPVLQAVTNTPRYASLA